MSLAPGAVVALAVVLAPAVARADCLELLFKDQRGRTQTYPAQLDYDDGAGKIAITYEHLGGRLELTLDERAVDHATARGHWHQDDGGGSALLRFETNHRRAVGWWTFGDAGRHYDLTLRPCPAKAP
jgi:hypothetical protein